MNNLDHLNHVLKIAHDDAEGVRVADKGYGASWKRRGGVGAFMMLARKWDRLELRAQQHGWDVFEAIAKDDRAEGIIDDIRDLRRYLLLVEAEMKQRGAVAAETTHRDNPPTAEYLPGPDDPL